MLLSGLNAEQGADLANSWEWLVEESGANQHAAEVYQDLLTNYSDKRVYHGLGHVYALLNRMHSFIEQEQLAAEEIQQCMWAIWFHDVIYNTRAKDNELLSAKYAEEQLVLLGLPDMAEPVSILVKATAGHTLAHVPDSLLNAAQHFLDADIAILGSQLTSYQAYAAAIREEYSWVPRFMYRRGRRKLLLEFMARDTIYFTPHFKADREQQARDNMQWELSTL